MLKSNGPPSDLAGLPQTCVPKATLSHGAFRLDNNDWGAVAFPHQQCIYASAAPGPAPQFGWTWEYISPSGGVMAYPEVIFGKKPFDPGTTTSTLPTKVSDLQSLRVDFALRTQATGMFNAAFEVWLTRSVAATEPEITYEVMWWIGAQGGPTPAGKIVVSGLTLSDGRVCDLWCAEPGKDGWTRPWTYFAFEFRQPLTSGALDCGEYLKRLEQRGQIPSDHFVACLEFGNEIWNGDGYTIVDRYEVILR